MCQSTTTTSILKGRARLYRKFETAIADVLQRSYEVDIEHLNKTLMEEHTLQSTMKKSIWYYARSIQNKERVQKSLYGGGIHRSQVQEE